MKKLPVMKRPARSTPPAARTEKVILQGKLSKLEKNARPKKGELWLWGAVVQGSPRLFFLNSEVGGGCVRRGAQGREGALGQLQGAVAARWGHRCLGQ
eukprot:535872-Pyramimonas_sp.AAC.1